MSTSRPDKSTNGNAPAELTYFEQQREALVGEIATVCPATLTLRVGANSVAELRECAPEHQQA